MVVAILSLPRVEGSFGVGLARWVSVGGFDWRRLPGSWGDLGLGRVEPEGDLESALAGCGQPVGFHRGLRFVALDIRHVGNERGTAIAVVSVRHNLAVMGYRTGIQLRYLS